MLVQTPPDVALVNCVVEPATTVVAPLILAGALLALIVVVNDMADAQLPLDTNTL